MRKLPEPLHDLTALQRDILTVIDGQPGSHVADELEEHRGRLRGPTIYDNLDALIEDGYVEKSKVDGRTNAYDLTDDGEEALMLDMEWRVRQLED